mgnify:FL=1
MLHTDTNSTIYILSLEMELNDARQQIGHQQAQIANLEDQIAYLQRQYGDFRRAVFGEYCKLKPEAMFCTASR